MIDLNSKITPTINLSSQTTSVFELFKNNWGSGADPGLDVGGQGTERTKGTKYLSHCSVRFAFNTVFVNWVTSLTPRVT